jgi:hypothetical protein
MIDNAALEKEDANKIGILYGEYKKAAAVWQKSKNQHSNQKRNNKIFGIET